MALTKITQPKAQSEPATPSSVIPTRVRLLYVEDNDANWDIAQLLLKGSYILTRGRTAGEMVDILGKSTFDIILMDIELAGSELDGIQLTRLLRGRLKTFRPILPM